MLNKFILIVSFSFIFLSVKSQTNTSEPDGDEKFTPYELMSSYYTNNFKPFKKRNIYVGMAFSLEDRQMENTENVLQKVIDGERLNYNVLVKGGYYISDYSMVGLNINFFENKFEGIVYRDPDTLQSNSITRGFAVTPNFRSSVPLTKNERLSFFTRAGLTFGSSNTLNRTIKNEDEVDKNYTSDYNFRVGITPGVTFFAMENFAFEVELDILGYELNVENKSVNDGDESRKIRQNVDFNINLLSLKLGLAYYFASRKNY